MIKLLIGGSPCTHWSIAQTKNRETTPEGVGWELFRNFVIAKEKFKPDFYLYENNKSAAPAIKEQICEELGHDLMYINSALVSAQNRQRFYVFNGKTEQPKDRGILLKDILETDDWIAEKEKAYALAHIQGNMRDYITKHHTNIVFKPVRVGDICDTKQEYRVYSANGKLVALKANGGGQGRIKITGVRKAESINRNRNGGLIKILGKEKTMQKLADEIGADFSLTKKGGIILNDDNDESRRVVEQCYRTTSTMINPIVDWTDEDVWEFLHHYGCNSNPLYSCGYKRIGCIGCPMAGEKQQKKSLLKYPKYRDNYIRAFGRMLKERKKRGKESILWNDGVDVMRWWVGDDLKQTELYTPEWLIGTERFKKGEEKQ